MSSSKVVKVGLAMDESLPAAWSETLTTDGFVFRATFAERGTPPGFRLFLSATQISKSSMIDRNAGET
jgi:hypothetical protein